MNRIEAPAIAPIPNPVFIHPQVHTFSNGVKAYTFTGGEQAVCRLDIVWAAGMWHDEKPLQARVTMDMLLQGTVQRTAEAIAKALDFVGAFVNSECGFDYATLSVYCLSKHFATVSGIISEVLLEASFPEKEWSIYKQNTLQRLQIDEQKNEFLARRDFLSSMYANKHPYGIGSQKSHYDALSVTDLQQFYTQYLRPSNATYLLSGMIDEAMLKEVEKLSAGESNEVANKQYTVSKAVEGLHYTEKTDALQSAIRFGKSWVRRSHKDFSALQVLLTIFGGYFGSRLMQNIREDKGYTYGIGGGAVSLLHGAHISFATEVGVQYTKSTLAEIEKEIEKLQKELITEAELDLVRNHMIGSFGLNLDGIFAHADMYKMLMQQNLGYEYYQNHFDTIRNISPERLIQLANEYLPWKDMTVMVVGKV